MTSLAGTGSRRVAAGVAIGFGILTVISGGSALLGSIDMGAVVPFVLWFNFFAGFAYVLAGIGLWLGLRWSRHLSLAIFTATVAVLASFLLHVVQGGAYEMRTAIAMALRAAVWGVIAVIAAQSLGR